MGRCFPNEPDDVGAPLDLAVQALVKKLKGPVLCLVGPPGVGKTSLIVNTAACLVKAGKRVLLFDLDTQSNASIWLLRLMVNCIPVTGLLVLEIQSFFWEIFKPSPPCMISNNHLVGKNSKPGKR